MDLYVASLSLKRLEILEVLGPNSSVRTSLISPIIVNFILKNYSRKNNI
jgi:hypothetical protein